MWHEWKKIVDWFAAGTIRDSSCHHRQLYRAVSLSSLPHAFSFLVYHDVCFSNKFPSRVEMKPRRNEAKLISPTASELIRKISVSLHLNRRYATRWIWYWKSGPSYTRCLNIKLLHLERDLNLKIFGIKSQLIYCHHGGITYLSMTLTSSMFSRGNRMRCLIVEDTWYSAA